LVLLQQHGTNVHLFRGVEAPPAPRPPPPAAATCRQLPPAAARPPPADWAGVWALRRPQL